MNKHFFYQLCIAGLIVILLFLAANPFGLFMPSSLVMVLVCSIAVSFFAFAAFVLKEHAHDEREQYHNLIAGKYSFLVGATILVIAVIVKELNGTPDPWLIGALGAMVLTKVIVRILTEIHH